MVAASAVIADTAQPSSSTIRPAASMRASARRRWTPRRSNAVQPSAAAVPPHILRNLSASATKRRQVLDEIVSGLGIALSFSIPEIHSAGMGVHPEEALSADGRAG